jgi:hypothetical protein
MARQACLLALLSIVTASAIGCAHAQQGVQFFHNTLLSPLLRRGWQ